MTTVKSHQAQPGGNTCRLSSWSYLNVLPFHDEVAAGVRYVPFMDRTIPVLDCGALAGFKAMFDRTKDWADIEAMVSWMSDTRPLAAQGRLIVKHSTRTVKAIVRELQYRLDVNTLHRDETATELSLNEIGRVTMRLTQPVFCDPYSRNRMTGGLILIDEATNATVGAAMITDN